MKALNWMISDNQGLIHLVAGITNKEFKPYFHDKSYRRLHTASGGKYIIHIPEGGPEEVLMCCDIWLKLQPRSEETRRATCLLCLSV